MMVVGAVLLGNRVARETGFEFLGWTAGFSVILLCCGVGYMGVRSHNRSYRRGRTNQITPHSDVDMARIPALVDLRGSPAVYEEAEAVEAKLIIYNAEDDYGTGLECAICQEGIKKGDECLKLSCNHNFHYGCLIQWKNYKGTCPTCRKPFSISDQTIHSHQDMERVRAQQERENAAAEPANLEREALRATVATGEPPSNTPPCGHGGASSPSNG